MKQRLTFYALSIVLLFSACATSKEARRMKKDIDGEWVLQTITTEGITGKFDALVFGEADYTCFVGSAWNFNSNNSIGSYKLDGNSKGCSPLTREIRWSIYEPKGAEKELQFKKLDDKRKDIDNGNGYRLHIVQLDSKTMRLKSDITFLGNAAAIIYNFTKK